MPTEGDAGKADSTVYGVENVKEGIVLLLLLLLLVERISAWKRREKENRTGWICFTSVATFTTVVT